MPPTEKTRVLIVDDIQETRENIRRMLQFEVSVEVVGAAKNGQEAIEMAQELKPDVVIMDINMPDMDGITATELIRKKCPAAQIVILSVQSDPNYMRRAMLAGARDFLTKPPMIDELIAAVKRAGVMAQDERTKTSTSYPSLSGDSRGTGSLPAQQKGTIVVVYSPKGGVGCTMVACNLALALESMDLRTLLVDGSLQFGDVAVMLNEQGKNNIIDLTKRVDELDPEVVNEVVSEHSTTNLRILASPPRPEMADAVSGEEFGKLLEYLRQLYTYVVVDTASYMTEVVQAAMEYADLIVLVTTQDIPAIKSCNLFLSLASASNIRDRVLFVMNRFDKRLKITPEKVGESLHQEIVATIPLDEKVIPNSINRGVPFVLENKTYPTSKSIIGLAELIQSRIQTLESSEEKEYVSKK